MPQNVGESVSVIQAGILNVTSRIGADRTDITSARYGVIHDVPNIDVSGDRILPEDIGISIVIKITRVLYLPT